MLRDNDGPHGSAGHRTPASEGHAQAVTGCRASPASIGRLLLIRLLNSSNTCYMNASIRAWLYAVSHMQAADILKYGQHEQAWRDVYHVHRPTHVHSLPSWRPLLRNWAQLHRQHDAGEFLEHILGICQPQVLQGRWESRIVSVEDGTESRGSNVTQRAIILDLSNPSITGIMVTRICRHALTSPELRISRFRAGPMGATIKLHTRVAIPMKVQIPAFMHRTLGAECSHHSYTVVACILHCGATADAGHYTVRYLNHMSPREAPEAPYQWIADDSKPAQSLRIRPNNDVVLGQQCYLALLCRTNP